MAVPVSIILYLGAVFWAFVFGVAVTRGSGHEPLFAPVILVALFLCAALLQVSA